MLISMRCLEPLCASKWSQTENHPNGLKCVFCGSPRTEVVR